jgi:hypothetical protein
MAESIYITPSNNSYIKYVALLTQNGITEPSAVVLENTIGEINWVRNNVGDYSAVFTGGTYTNFKTAVFTQVNTSLGATTGVKYTAGRADNNNVFLLTQREDGSSTNEDGLLSLTPIEIRIYR